MNFLKALLRFFIPWPQGLFSKVPHEGPRFKYWQQFHGGLQGGSAVVFFMLYVLTYAGPIFHMFHKYILPTGLTAWHVVIVLAVGLAVCLYYGLLWYRLYHLIWNRFDPWFESKYKKPPVGGGGCQAI